MWEVWQMTQSYHKTPSEVYNVYGAAGLCFDRGVFLFGRWVEGELSAAESQARNEMFARSSRARAFARCMGDDMATSTAGFADPALSGPIKRTDEPYPDDIPFPIFNAAGEVIDEGY